MFEKPAFTSQDPSLIAGNTAEQKLATMMEQDAHQWHERMDALMADGAHIITFRGAGTVNGIDPAAATAATEAITNYVSSLAEDGMTVAIMFDGDEDNREKPDVGVVFGVVADALKDKPNVVPIAAQTKSWYYPKSEGAALESATGTPYETFVFPDDMPGSHAALTQSEALARYSGYEQVFVGPAGPIAFNQLQDVNDKAAGREAGPMRVTVLETPLNHQLDQVFQGQLEASSDDEARAKVQAKIDQRAAQPYGALFSPEGELAVQPDQYPNLDIQVNRV
ncbi:MAG TPA: hypothetical protein VFN56_00700 [Candidatus Saccharimonadales bacterium]|nr:hypothetical protein [Candidatus Saccharimonadales bacterium]